ncbi:MAG TPA: hypothetical protein VFO85_17290, partial [Vicinamibacteria bacterium]|nr:hypothetical protein [Vicinamibacteria bacterium]
TRRTGGEGAACCQLGAYQVLAHFEVEALQPDRMKPVGIIVRDDAKVREVRGKVTGADGLTAEPGSRCDVRDRWGDRIQVVHLHDESLVWLLPYQEVQATGLAFPDAADAGARGPRGGT